MKMLRSLVCLVTVLSALSPAQAAWQRLPALANRPTEVAVGALNGNHIESSNRIGRVSALLSDGVSEAASMPTGKSDAVIAMGWQAVIDRVSFQNSGGEGRFAISASTDNNRWTPLGQILFSPADSLVALPFAGIQCKYVKVEYELSKAASVRNFEVFGRLLPSEDTIHGQISNMATSLAGARIIYVDPSPKGGSDVAANYGSFAFPDSEERYRTVIYDLGKPRVLNEFGSVHSPRPVRFEVYAFTELPEREDWRGRKSFDPAAFNDTKPIASYEDRVGKGYFKVKPSQVVTARYVALRWEPDFNPPAFTVGGIEIIGPPDQIVDNTAGSTGFSTDGQASYYTGAFIPNSLMGAGSAGLPFSTTAGGGSGGLPDVPDLPPISNP